MARKQENLDRLIFLAMPAIRKFYRGSNLEPEERDLCQRLHDALEAKMEQRHDLTPEEERLYRLVGDVVDGVAIPPAFQEMIPPLGPVNQTDRMHLG